MNFSGNSLSIGNSIGKLMYVRFEKYRRLLYDIRC